MRGPTEKWIAQGLQKAALSFVQAAPPCSPLGWPSEMLQGAETHALPGGLQFSASSGHLCRSFLTSFWVSDF